MKKISYIGINEATITGTKNPLLTIKGKIKKKEYNFLVYVNGKKIKYDNVNQGFEDLFAITANLGKDVKNVEVYIVTDRDKELIYEAKTNLLKRIIKTVLYKIKRFVKKVFHFFRIIKRGISFFWREYHFLVPISLLPKYWRDFKNSMKRGESLFYNPNIPSEYRKWLDLHPMNIKTEKLDYNPLVSIVTPVYNVDEEKLSECIESVLNQTYENWELCLVDDASKNSETIQTLKKYEAIDNRIKVKYNKENGHISKTSNDAIRMSSGEFIALLDNDDTLDKNALYIMVRELNKNRSIDMLYSDEDKLDTNNKRCEPHFKPDFSPDTLLSLNYICHFTMIRKNLIEKVGGFEIGLEGAQDYDLFLKITEQTKNIVHVPYILYHWRMSETSTAKSMKNKEYAINIGKKVLEKALERRKIDAIVEVDKKSSYYRIKYNIKKQPLVSIIIPTRDFAETLKTCVDSIFDKTTYKNYEIIVANNESKEPETFKLFNKYKKEHKNFKVVDINIEFNYSKINNIAVSKAKGEYIILLNNDTEVITPEWIEYMIGYAMQEHVGCVGAKLLYPDNTIQHGGVVLGLGGVASHAYIASDRDDIGMFGRLRVPYNYAANTAACLAIKKDKYEEIGGLEEELKVAYNDIDFNIKLLEKGYYNVFLPQVELTHFESKSRGLDTTSEKYKRFKIESKYMYDHWRKMIDKDPFYNDNFSKKGWFQLDKK
ncbi:MAG: glycosyltransferase [Bacilli bacterium]|nr:glycosyltransferase [Bacilli bacterium]